MATAAPGFDREARGFLRGQIGTKVERRKRKLAASAAYMRMPSSCRSPLRVAKTTAAPLARC